MDTSTLGKIVAFLCSVPPNSALRLMLQLALAASIPEDKRELLISSLQQQDLLDSLQKDNLLASLLKADGDIGEAEANMLLETMERVGLVVPMNIGGAELLLEDLSEYLVSELQEIQEKGTVNEELLAWGKDK